MNNNHVNADKLARNQRAQQAAERRKAQLRRGSTKFIKGSNDHNGGSRGQSGEPKPTR